MARTRKQIRQRIGQQIGLNVFRTGTADSGGSTTQLIDAARKLEKDDFFVGAHIYLSDGSPTLRELMVTSSTQSTGALDFRPTLGAAPDGLAYEILPVSATEIHQVAQDALDEMYERGSLTRTHWSSGLVAGSPAYNAGFDYWPSGFTNVPDGYDFSGESIERYTDAPAISEQACLLNNGTLTVADPFRRFFLDFRGGELRLYAWVWAGNANETRIGLNVDGTVTYSSYHSGDSQWELLEVTVDLAEDVNTITPTFTTTGSAGIFSDWWVEGDDVIREYPVPRAFLPHGPAEIWVSTSDGRSESPNPLRQQDKRQMEARYVFHEDASLNRSTGVLVLLGPQPARGHRMYARFETPITLPSDDTTYVEVTPTEEIILAKRAAARILEGLMGRLPPALSDGVLARISLLNSQADELEAELYGQEAGAKLPIHFVAV